MPACARHPTPTEASETCSLQACSKQVHAMQPPLTPTTNKATLGSPACARIKTRRWHLTLAVCRLPSCARHQTRRWPLAACSLQACSERVHAMQPHNEIDCNSFLCTFTALYYFPFSANGLACFLNKCDVANVVSIHKISRRRIFYMSVPRRDGDTAATAARRGWYLLTTHAHCWRGI